MNKLTKIVIEDAKDSIKGINAAELAGKTILITGASGILGTYLLGSLHHISKTLSSSLTIYAVCQSEPQEYWKELATHCGATILHGDLCDDSFTNKLPRADYIIHAAGYGQPGKFLEKPAKTLKLNTTVTQTLIEKLNPQGKFLFVSTSEVYSGLKVSPFREDQIGTTNTDHPRSCYIEGKRGGEALVYAARTQGVAAKSARLSLAYGPGTRLDDKRVLYSFINRALTDKKITMMDGGEALRTYCYITDAVNMIWNILLHGNDNIYNVGGISNTTIKELAELIGKKLNVPVTFPPSKNQAFAGAPEDVRLDLQKTENEFGRHQFVSLEEGVERTISWQKELHNL